ncbi:Dynein regulatory complex protein 11 [Blyttiomyces sp. JEL0837]|nr:Dynein regulatory complex protein 11 [Blyttiomyces sp. JEL0837]
MSNLTFNKLWNDAHQKLLDQIEYESPKDVALIPKDRESAFQHLAVLYVKYIQIYRKLEISYDQIVQPQKRRLLKEILVSVIGRLLELRQKLVEVEMSDVCNYTDILLDLKLVPDDLQVPIPRFTIEEREKDIASRRAMLDTLGAREITAGEVNIVFPEIKLADAVRIIQINERGRQGKLRAKYMRDIKMQAEREKELDGGDDEGEVNSAALRIQRVYRGYKSRKLARQMLQEELVFLGNPLSRYHATAFNASTFYAGMAAPQREWKHSPTNKAELNRSRRKVVQTQHEEEYQASLVNTKEKIAKVEGPDMKESLQDSFRQWYMEFKRINGKFPEFPPDKLWQQPGFQFSIGEDGKDLSGAGLDTNNEPPKTADDGASSSGKKSAKSAGKGDKGKDKGKGKGSAKKGKDDQEDDEPKFKFDDSSHLTTIKQETNNFATKWLTKDETDNFAQKHDQEIVKTEKRREVEAEVKKDVFEILKEELKNLKLAVDRDKNSKSRKGKKGKKGKSAKGGKKKGGKKDKKGKKGGKKGKKEKDLTANRTMESILEELIQTGILQKYPKCAITDIKGDFDLLAPSVTKDPFIEPTLAEIRRLLTEYCILPLNYPKPETIPSNVSFFFVGPRGTGKTLFVNAIASETGAYLFNLSPRNTAGQFVGKPNVTKMVHMVFKAAKANPPSIIYIDNAEMIFAKKVPKDDQSDPKRIKKDLLKNMKGLKPEDRVMLIGTSWKPWDADLKAMLPIFSKILFTPKPDYSSRFIIWRDLITKKASNHAKYVNVSLLSRMSEGLSAGSLNLICERVLTDRRVKLMKARRLSTNEFVEQLLNLPPLNAEEGKLYKDWFEKTPLIKQRIAALTTPAEGDEKDKKKDGGKKKK